MTSPALTEAQAKKLALDWTCLTRRQPADVMRELRRLYGHKDSKDAKPKRCKWEHVYFLMWPLLMESETYANRIRRAVASARRRDAERETERETGRVVA